MGPTRKQLGQRETHQGIPPGGVIEDEDEWAVRHQPWSPAPGKPHRMEVACQVESLHMSCEETNEPGRVPRDHAR